MTCLIGLIQDGQAYIGADGYATTEDGERKPIIARKIFTSGKYLVAFSGHIRTGQLLYPESGFEFPDDIYQIPNHMYLWLREFEVIGKDEAQMGMICCNLMIAYNNKLYEIMADMQISEIDPTVGYTALGSGTQFAMGNLYATSHFSMGAKERIQMALDVASEFTGSCGPPYYIYSYNEAMKSLKSTLYKHKKTRTKKKSS